MNEHIRRRYPALLLLAFGSLLAAISFWALEVAQRGGDEARPQTARTEPDYFIEDFSYTRLAPNGKAQYLITGKKLVHYPTDDSSVIERPTVRSFSAKSSPMTLSAQRAKITKKQREVHLYDQVRLERPQTRDAASLVVESDYMLALPDEDLVKTDRPVVIRAGESRLSGTGMVADNTKHQLTLQSRVTGFYESPR
jgi:lipopolysaccharide export system protein LptC